MIEWNCWACKEPMDAPESLLGELVPCPKCLTKNLVGRSRAPLGSEANTNERPPAAMPAAYAGGGGLLLAVAGLSILDAIGKSDMTEAVQLVGVVVLLVGGTLLLGLGGIAKRLDRTTGDSS